MISSEFGSEDLNGSSQSRRKRKKSQRVKYWTLPTMSSGNFNPSLLTERQQLQYLAQKSIKKDDCLEISPCRLDRIKLEEMRSLPAAASSPLAAKDAGFNFGVGYGSGSALINSTPNKMSKSKKRTLREEMEDQVIIKNDDMDNVFSLMPSPRKINPLKAHNSCEVELGPSKLSEKEIEFCPIMPENNTVNTDVDISIIEDEPASVQKEADITPQPTIVIETETEAIKSAPMSFLSDKIKSALEFYDQIRNRHLKALVECVMVRKGLGSAPIDEESETFKQIKTQLTSS